METIKHVRKRIGLSLADVAKRSGLLRQAVARADRAGVDPRVSTALAIAKALDVPMCELLDEGANHGRHRKTRATRR